MVKLHCTPQSIEDLEAIFEYISHDSRSIAILLVEIIYFRVDQPRHFPLSGRTVPEIEDETIQELIYKNYRIVYQVLNEDQRRIIILFHSSKIPG